MDNKYDKYVIVGDFTLAAFVARVIAIYKTLPFGEDYLKNNATVLSDIATIHKNMVYAYQTTGVPFVKIIDLHEIVKSSTVLGFPKLQPSIDQAHLLHKQIVDIFGVEAIIQNVNEKFHDIVIGIASHKEVQMLMNKGFTAIFVTKASNQFPMLIDPSKGHLISIDILDSKTQESISKIIKTIQ